MHLIVRALKLYKFFVGGEPEERFFQESSGLLHCFSS